MQMAMNWCLKTIIDLLWKVFLARPAFSLLRPRSSNRLEAEEEEEDKVKSLSLFELLKDIKPQAIRIA